MKVSKTTGVIEVSAVGVGGTLLWGVELGSETTPFDNVGTCLSGTTAKKCNLADPATVAAKTPPSDCTLYLDDGVAACSAFIAGCTPGLRSGAVGPVGPTGPTGAPPAPVCGNTVGAVGEACDGLDLNGQTCQSAGYLYGTLACAACALDISGCTNARYQDNGDGTVSDHETNLMWEKKTTAVGSGANPWDWHDVDNTYSWSTGSPYNPDGTAFTSFLVALNGPGPFAGHDDWRLPTITELEGIMVAGPAPTIDPVFGATQWSDYWSSTTSQNLPTSAWIVNFNFGNTAADGKTSSYYVHAVRAGS